MDKSRAKNNFKFFLFLLVLCFIAFGGVLFFQNENERIEELFGIDNDSTYIKDNYNGVYVYSESLNGSKGIFQGCTTDRINYYILIKDDKYYTYRSSCIGTFRFEEGNSKTLDIYENKEANTFYIKYNDNVYSKNSAIRTIKLENRFLEYSDTFLLNNYDILFKESQFPNFYYDVPKLKVMNVSGRFFIEFEHIYDERFKLLLYSETENGSTTLYNYIFDDFEHMPGLYPYGAYIVAIEKNEEDHKYSYNIKAFDEAGVAYNLEDHFPIVVDGKTLDINSSVYINFDIYSRDFKILIGNDKQMCVEESDSNDVTYYEFSVDYNYAIDAFERPRYVKKGYAKDGCSYVREVMGR